jgi:hypothetical protein
VDEWFRVMESQIDPPLANHCGNKADAENVPRVYPLASKAPTTMSPRIIRHQRALHHLATGCHRYILGCGEGAVGEFSDRLRYHRIYDTTKASGVIELDNKTTNL